MNVSRRVLGVFLCVAVAGFVACTGGPGAPPTPYEQDEPDGGSADSGTTRPPDEDCSNAGCALPPKCKPDGTPGPRPRCSCSCSAGEIIDGMMCTELGCLAPLPDAGDDAGDGG